jgi:hypothetical protein
MNVVKADGRLLMIIDHVDGVRLSQNRGHQRAYCLFPRWYVNVENHGYDDGWEKLLTCPPELSGSPASRVV